LGRCDKALKDITKGLDIDSTSQTATPLWFLRGLVLKKLNRIGDSLSSLSKAMPFRQREQERKKILDFMNFKS